MNGACSELPAAILTPGLVAGASGLSAMAAPFGDGEEGRHPEAASDSLLLWHKEEPLQACQLARRSYRLRWLDCRWRGSVNAALAPVRRANDCFISVA